MRIDLHLVMVELTSFELSDFHSNKLTIRLYSKKREGHVISSQFSVHQFTDGLAVVVPDFIKTDVVYRFLCFDLMIFLLLMMVQKLCNSVETTPGFPNQGNVFYIIIFCDLCCSNGDSQSFQWSTKEEIKHSIECYSLMFEKMKVHNAFGDNSVFTIWRASQVITAFPWKHPTLRTLATIL